MLSPAVSFIEQAADRLKDVPKQLLDSQQKELSSFGDERARQLGATGLSSDFRIAYNLGLQTGRAVLATNVTLILKDVKTDELL